MIELSDQMIACKFDSRIKQLDTRLSKFSGFLDLGFTVGYSFVTHDSLYDTMMSIADYGDHVSCENYGKNIGKFVSKLLEVSTPDEVFYNYVSRN